jgi:endo-1,4-beta-xylanase
MNRAAVTSMLNDYATLGLDVYVSELDIIANNTEAGQLAKYQDVFPGFWEHSSVKGVTLWGYIVGQTWVDGSGIVNSNGTERQAMTWLKSYVAGTGGGDTQAPTAPSGSGCLIDHASSVSLAWTASTDNVGVTGYQILRAPGASGGTFAQVGTSTTPSFTNTGLTASTTYRFQVRAVDAAGNTSAVSNTVTAATQAGGGDTQAADRAVEPRVHRHQLELGVAVVDRVDRQCRRDGLPDPARAGRERRHVRAGGHLDHDLIHQHRADGQHHVPLPGARVDAAGNTSAVSNTVTAATQAGGGTGACSITPTTQTSWARAM